MINSDKLVLHGVGEAVLLSADGKASATLMKLQSMNIEITSETQDVYGGIGLFPFYNFITSKSATFSFTNAVCDMNVIGATQGSMPTTGGEAFAIEEITVATSNNLKKTSGVEVDSVVVIKDGVALTRTSDTPATSEFKVTEAGALTFGTDTKTGDKVKVSYVYTVANGTALDVHVDDVAGYVELRHTSEPVEMDGKYYVMNTRVYKARCEGGFNLSYTRDGAVAPEVSFKSVDPERADKKFVSYSLIETDKDGNPKVA